jgi:hypothetical protein
MKHFSKRNVSVCLVLSCLFALQSCATLNDMAAFLATLQKLKFKLQGVRDFRLLGMDLSGKSLLGQFSAGDAFRMAQSYASKKLPVDFVVDVLAINPNDGTGGSKKTTSTLTSLECRLLIDQKPTVTGNIEKPVEIPGTGQETVLPIRISFDLFEFFSDKRYDDMVQLALAVGGKNRNASRISLDAQPSVQTPAGPITYPGRITIVSTEFR